MEAFHGEMKRQKERDLAAAPQAAQLSLPRGDGTHPVGKYAHPYYWAPFILMGNWR
jgi:CHAT domain-containing protein